jgi:hypothetical protein
MTDKELIAKLETIKNVGNSPVIEELCDILIDVITTRPREEKAPGFIYAQGTTFKAVATGREANGEQRRDETPGQAD